MLEEILSKLKSEITSIIAEVAEISEAEITEEAPLQDLGVDSIMALEIVALVEQKYKVEISEEEMAEINTVGDILANLAHRGLVGNR